MNSEEICPCADWVFPLYHFIACLFVVCVGRTKKKKKPNVDLSYYKLYWTSHQAMICLQGFQTSTIKKSNVVGMHMVEHIIYGPGS